MSEIKQEILDLLILNGRKPQTIKSGERVVYLYDALNIVNKEFTKTEQPQLNENQQVVLGYLKEMMISFDLCNAIYRLESAEDWGHASEPYDIAYESLNDKERLQVVQAACQWAQEWEEPV